MVGSDYTSNAHFVIAEDTVMGLFDQVTGMMGGGDAGKFKVILTWINEQGGIQAILERFREKGFSDVVTS